MSKFISTINKIKDSIKFDEHRKFRIELVEFIRSNIEKKYDYGTGYFYQSLEKINLSGLRCSKKRVNEYNIDNFVKDAKVLDIGCNSGFLICELEQNFQKCVGIEWNKTLVDIGKKTIDYLNLNNIEFINADDLKYDFKEYQFNVIFSFANHSTFDKGITSSDIHFEKCDSLLEKNGILIVESHHPNYEKKENFMNLVEKIVKLYSYEKIKIKTIKSNYFYDNNRTLVILKKNS